MKNLSEDTKINSDMQGPYEIIEEDGTWSIVTREDNELVGQYDSEEEANKALKDLVGDWDSGWQSPTDRFYQYFKRFNISPIEYNGHKGTSNGTAINNLKNWFQKKYDVVVNLEVEPYSDNENFYYLASISPKRSHSKNESLAIDNLDPDVEIIIKSIPFTLFGKQGLFHIVERTESVEDLDEDEEPSVDYAPDWSILPDELDNFIAYALNRASGKEEGFSGLYGGTIFWDRDTEKEVEDLINDAIKYLDDNKGKYYFIQKDKTRVNNPKIIFRGTVPEFENSRWVNQEVPVRSGRLWGHKLVPRKVIKVPADANELPNFGGSMNKNVNKKLDESRISFEDDIVVVTDKNGKIIYKGMEDYEPMKYDDWKYDVDADCYRLGEYTKIKLGESLKEGFSITALVTALDKRLSSLNFTGKDDLNEIGQMEDLKDILNEVPLGWSISNGFMTFKKTSDDAIKPYTTWEMPNTDKPFDDDDVAIMIADYLGTKVPSIPFHILDESLKEGLTTEDKVNVGAASAIMDLINQEYSLLQAYDSVQVTLDAAGDNRFEEIFNYIADDINIHVGMLQSCLEDINGTQEQTAEGEQKANELMGESLKESGYIVYSETGNPIWSGETDSYESEFVLNYEDGDFIFNTLSDAIQSAKEDGIDCIEEKQMDKTITIYRKGNDGKFYKYVPMKDGSWKNRGLAESLTLNENLFKDA